MVTTMSACYMFLSVLREVPWRSQCLKVVWCAARQAVESMRRGMRPRAAAEDAVRRILEHYPGYVGALVTVNARYGM